METSTETKRTGKKLPNLLAKTIKNDVAITKEQYIDIVTAYILENSDITRKLFYTTRTQFRMARNKYIAHIDIGKIPAMPNITDGYNIAKSYSYFLSQAQADNVHEVHTRIEEREAILVEEAKSIYST